MVEKIVSSGQTGAESAGLDVAIRWELAHGGWCPSGRMRSDGSIPDCYKLTETSPDSDSFPSEWNVRDSDATVVFTRMSKATGRAREVMRLAAKLGKPCLHLPFTSRMWTTAGELLLEFVEEHEIKVLHVAGSREEEEPGIYALVTVVLEEALF